MIELHCSWFFLGRLVLTFVWGKGTKNKIHEMWAFLQEVLLSSKKKYHYQSYGNFGRVRFFSLFGVTIYSDTCETVAIKSSNKKKKNIYPTYMTYINRKRSQKEIVGGFKAL